ncbi:hypothetical protein Tco_0638063 [Tanacetum coccineum]
MQLKELMVLVPTLVTRINSLEKELKDTQQTLGNAVLKLVKKVKSLETALKRKSKKWFGVQEQRVLLLLGRRPRLTIESGYQDGTISSNMGLSGHLFKYRRVLVLPDYDNPDLAPELQNVFPSADTIVPSQKELDLLFGPLYDEFFNDGTSRVNKSSSPTDNSAPQDTHPSTNIHPTSEPSTLTNVHVEENNDNQAEFTNPFCTPVQENAESSSRNIGSAWQGKKIPRKKLRNQWRKPWNKTRADYGSGIARPKIDEKDHFELKGQFLKELRDNTFSGSDHEDANEHTEKVLEIVDLFHVPNITQDQIMLRVFSMSLTGAASRWLRNKPAGSIKTWEDLKTKTRSTKTSDGLAAIQAQLNNLGREIKKVNEKVYAAQVGCEQCKGNYTKDCPLKEEGKTLKEAYYTQFGAPFQGGGYRAAAPGFYQRNNTNPSLPLTLPSGTKVLQERGFRSLPSSTETNPRDHVKSISTTVEADITSIRRIGSSQYVKGSYRPQFLEANSCEASHIDNSIPRKEKDPGSFTLPCYINNVCFDNALADLGASVSVMPLSTYLNLGLGVLAHTKLTTELADRIVKYLKGIAENVLVGIGKFVFPVDFIILDMPEDVWKISMKICIEKSNNIKYSFLSTLGFLVNPIYKGYRASGISI